MKPFAHSTLRQAGFSLVELMVAIAIGLFVLAGLAGIFSTNIQARSELERNNRQIENGRYAADLLTQDLRLAGFYGQFDPTPLTAPGTMPDPCSTTITASALTIPIQGYYHYSSSTNPGWSCLSQSGIDVKDNTDIIVVRRTSTGISSSSCSSSDSSCEAIVSGRPYFQVSLCNSSSQLGSPNSSDWYVLGTDTSSSVMNRTKRNCTDTADIRRFLVHIYFVSTHDNTGDGIPTLKRLELDSSGFTVVPLVEGVEDLQAEYGLDTGNTGVASTYTADPNKGCTGSTCVTNWQSVVSVKFHLLVRNTEKTLGYIDTNTYNLGLDSSGNTYSVTITDSSLQGYKRHVYQSVAALSNIAGRRAQ